MYNYSPPFIQNRPQMDLAIGERISQYESTGGVSNDKYQNVSKVTYDTVQNGVRNPDFATRMKNKESVTSAYSATYRKVLSRLPCTFTMSVPNGVKTYRNTFRYCGVLQGHPFTATAGTIPPGAKDLEEINYYLRQKILRKLEERDPQIDGLPYLTEWEKTKVLHREVFASMVNLMEDIFTIVKKKGFTKKGWSDLIVDVSGLWLAWRFAIKPTLGDVLVASENLAALNSQRVSRLGATLREPRVFVNPAVTTNAYSAFGSQSIVVCKKTVSSTTTYKQKYAVLLRARPVPLDQTYNVMLIEGLLRFVNTTTLKGIVSNLWEIIPFSWFIAYLTQVDKLWAHDVIVLEDVLSCTLATTTTTTYTTRYSFELSSSAPLGTRLSNVFPGEYVCETTTYRREIVDLQNFAEFTDSPAWEPDLSPLRWSYILSVIAQLTHKRRN